MTKTILCYGDSNTHGTPALKELGSTARFPKEARWPNVMAAQLGEGFDVISEGLPGRNSCFDDPVEGEGMNGLRLIQPVLRSHQPIDLVIVMLGTNDLKARFNATSQDIALGTERIVMAIKQSPYGQKMSAPNAMIAAPVPILETGCLAEMFSGGTAKSIALPDHLREVAVRQGVPLIELGNVAQVDPLDGVHLTADSQVAIGNAMVKKVQDVLG